MTAAALLGLVLAAAGGSDEPALAPEPPPPFRVISLALLHGDGFDDAVTGNDTADGVMTTLTVEGFSEWPYGDLFFFVDFSHGDFGSGPGSSDHLYAEVLPRLSLSKVAGTRLAFGPVGDVLVAAEFNRSFSGFVADMAGIGFDLRVPALAVLQLNLMARNDTFSSPSYQATLVWKAPFALGPVGFAFTGFADLYGTDDEAFNLMTQPQLAVDVGGPLGLGAGWLWAGSELYLHRTVLGTTVAPQAMLKVAW